MKIVVFGVGDLYYRYKHCLKDFEIVSYIDNNEKKVGNSIDNIPIRKPCDINFLEYDYIIIMSKKYKDMRQQLLDYGVDSNKIIDNKNRGVFSRKFNVESHLFYKEFGRKVLIFSHSLDLSGAPIAVCRLAIKLKEMGFNVTVLTEINSKLNYRELFELLMENEISVILANELNELVVDYYKDSYDFFIVNTLVLHYIVSILKQTKKNIYWWLHESDIVYNQLNEIEYSDADNIKVLTVGWMAQKAYEKNSNLKIYKNFLYGLPDINISCKCNSMKKNKIMFGIIASNVKIKGIDLLIKCLKEKREQWAKHAMFFFVGSLDKDTIEEIQAIDCASYLGMQNQTQIQDFYNKIDVLICASRSDTMPTVVSEAMQHSKMCIVSNKVGQFRYIINKKDGLVFDINNHYDLAKCIEWVIINKNKIEEIGKNSHLIYQRYFTMDRFRENVTNIFLEEKELN